jgi:8-oxo-dGTP pyrophosphatase MutT (NUDIX family)
MLSLDKLKDVFVDKPKIRNNRIPAAVMVIIHFKGKEPYIILTKRSKNLKNHASQISFPGGIKEKDENFIDAAIRETEEELGIKVSKDQIIGMLDSVDTYTSNFCIVPFVAIIDDISNMHINKDEIDEVIDANLLKLLKSRERDYRDDIKGIHYKFVYNDYIIWGATARILDILYNALMPK